MDSSSVSRFATTSPAVYMSRSEIFEMTYVKRHTPPPVSITRNRQVVTAGLEGQRTNNNEIERLSQDF